MRLEISLGSVAAILGALGSLATAVLLKREQTLNHSPTVTLEPREARPEGFGVEVRVQNQTLRSMVVDRIRLRKPAGASLHHQATPVDQRERRNREVRVDLETAPGRMSLVLVDVSGVAASEADLTEIEVHITPPALLRRWHRARLRAPVPRPPGAAAPGAAGSRPTPPA